MVGAADDTGCEGVFCVSWRMLRNPKDSLERSWVLFIVRNGITAEIVWATFTSENTDG